MRRTRTRASEPVSRSPAMARAPSARTSISASSRLMPVASRARVTASAMVAPWASTASCPASSVLVVTGAPVSISLTLPPARPTPERCCSAAPLVAAGAASTSSWGCAGRAALLLLRGPGRLLARRPAVARPRLDQRRARRHRRLGGERQRGHPAGAGEPRRDLQAAPADDDELLDDHEEALGH